MKYVPKIGDKWVSKIDYYPPLIVTNVDNTHIYYSFRNTEGAIDYYAWRLDKWIETMHREQRTLQNRKLCTL